MSRGIQIAVCYDKVHPPRRIDVTETTARAVVSLLASPAAAPGGSWNPAVDYWRDGCIRKLACWARGKRWEEVQDINGVIVTQDGPAGWGQAAACAFVSGPARPLPRALAKTQVEGTHFPPDDELPPPPAEITARVAQDPAAAEQIVLTAAPTSSGALVTIEVTPLHEMASSKLAAQCGHAAQLAWESSAMPFTLRQTWTEDGYRVRVVVPSREQWETTTRPVSVTGAGFIELDGPAETTCASWWGRGTWTPPRAGAPATRQISSTSPPSPPGRPTPGLPSGRASQEP